VTVKKSDFEVMEALTSDSILTTNQSSGVNKQQCGFFDIENSLIMIFFDN
jgi:hypothetical protein